MLASAYRSASIGASDSETDGVFMWVDGRPLEWASWLPSEPNGGVMENHLCIGTTGHWHDCAHLPYEYLCQSEGQSFKS